MPAYKVIKVVLEVEIEIKGALNYGDAWNKAAEPIEALPGYKVLTAKAERKL